MNKNKDSMDIEEIKQIAYDYTTCKEDCKKLENRILSLFSVVKSLPEWQIYQKAQELDEKEFEQWMYDNQ